MNRRDFIQKLGLGGLALGLSNVPLELLAGGVDADFAKISILHTNDMHSRIDPFPEGSKYAGLGGMAKRAQLIKKIRSEEEHVVLLDAGDIFQGTPYFNIYGGELEFKLMSEMAYDAATLGNHDFDAGLEGLVKQMPLAKFQFLNANYILDNTPLLGKVQAYQVIEKDDVRIGIFGVGIELKGLVPDKLFGEVQYTDPLVAANNTARILKEDLKCSLVVCLSHLGLKYESKKISDVVLAQNTENVDIIIGGHTHTFLDKPMVVNNLKGHPVVVNQVGWAGINLGRLDISIAKGKKKNKNNSRPAILSKKTIVK
ncbi:MAG: metallophosphatase [Chitinophagales bacterium]|nr:metallophosphatase [Chitinophagales bacterium]